MSLDHKPVFESKGRFLTPACKCGWRGKRGSYGNRSGYCYLRAALAEQWVKHATEHGLTDDGLQIRCAGVLLGTVKNNYDYRRRSKIRWQAGDLASRAHTICQMISEIQ